MARLTNGESRRLTGTLYVVATPIGNLADASPRAIETLRAADLIACEDTRASRTLLARHGINARTVALHEHNERAATPKLIAALRDGKNVALVSDAGTPGLADPGAWLVAEAHRAGALISINHPFVLCGGCAWSYDAAARDFDAIEVWNGPWDFTDEPALKMWEKILQSGRRITAVASSDSHRPDTPIGEPATHVAAKVLSQAALLKAIREGHAFLTDGASRFVGFEAEVTTGKHRSRWSIGDEIRLNAPGTLRFFISTEGTRPDATVSLISNGQTIRSFPAKTNGEPQVVEIDCRHDSYFRLEVRDGKKAMLALTNPIYVKIGRQR